MLARYIDAGADEIRVVSGYASPEMCTRLLLAARDRGREITIRLVVGMTGYEGVTLDTHQGFLSVQAAPPDGSGRLGVQYVTGGVSVHSKLFVWMRGREPLDAWMGSANFTQNGFGVGFRAGRHREIMIPTDVESALRYFDEIESQSLSGVTVKGDVKVQRDATAYVTGKSRVHGNVQAEGQRHVSVMSYSRVNGDVQAKEGNGAYVGGGVFVGGNVQMEKNRGKVTTISSTIDGDVQYFSNYSSTGAAKQISSNRINGNLQCKSNRPAPTGGKNIVKGNKEDQCRRL